MWLVLDYFCDTIYILDTIVRLRTGKTQTGISNNIVTRIPLGHRNIIWHLKEIQHHRNHTERRQHFFVLFNFNFWMQLTPLPVSEMRQTV